MNNTLAFVEFHSSCFLMKPRMFALEVNSFTPLRAMNEAPRASIDAPACPHLGVSFGKYTLEELDAGVCVTLAVRDLAQGGQQGGRDLRLSSTSN
jgi:hypothetical protein